MGGEHLAVLLAILSLTAGAVLIFGGLPSGSDSPSGVEIALAFLLVLFVAGATFILPWVAVALAVHARRRGGNRAVAALGFGLGLLAGGAPYALFCYGLMTCSGPSCDCSGCPSCATGGTSRREIWAGSFAMLRAPESAGNLLGHHPDHPRFDQDVFDVAGLRWCVGCFTTYPVFGLSAAVALPAMSLLPWWTWLVTGSIFAALQGVSTAGRCKTRRSKVVVKACLGAGLAFVLIGTLASPWPVIAKVVFLAAVLAAAHLSAIPRARRIRAWLAAHPQTMSGSQQGLSQWQRGHS